MRGRQALGDEPRKLLLGVPMSVVLDRVALQVDLAHVGHVAVEPGSQLTTGAAGSNGG